MKLFGSTFKFVSVFFQILLSNNLIELNAQNNIYPTASPLVSGQFPRGFIWSIATASYQIEGGWNASGKGRNIWDTLVHQKHNPVANGATGDVACDTFHNWNQDIQLLKNMGLKYYRFSLSWARIMPNGLKSQINQAGVQFYLNFIGNLTANGIQPMVTLYHWDLPQYLEDQGGWLNASSQNWFADYADFCFKTFGSMVKYWITFNEPYDITWLGYGIGIFAPQKTNCPGTCPYATTHNLLKAHAKAWHIYNSTYRSTQKGQVGISLNCDWMEPGSNSPADRAAAERNLQFILGWFANPIFSAAGDYPPIMKSIISNRSRAEGLSQSRLPSFSTQDINYIKGTYDFFGLNIYTASLAWNAPFNTNVINYYADAGVYTNKSNSWPGSGLASKKFTPWGARKLLNWVRKEYNNPPVIITENGWSDNNGSLHDTWRIHFYRWYLDEVLKAINIDKCNVKGFTAWALLDNFEWTSGYTVKFGMHYVNFSDPARPRTPKMSAIWYKNVIMNNGFPLPSSAKVKREASLVYVSFFIVVLLIFGLSH